MAESIRGLFVFFFGMLLAMAFSGITRSKVAFKKLFVFFLIELALQGGSNLLWGPDVVEKIYPLIGHVPMWFFLVLCFKVGYDVAFVSIVSAYLCCELPNVASKILSAPFGGKYEMEVFFYCISSVLILLLLLKHVTGSLFKLFQESKQQRLMFGSVPFLYYVWCYISSVYSNYMEQYGYQIAMFVSALFCFLFLLFAVAEHNRHEAEIKQNEALAASDAKSAFLANMSHEIRTPINAVLGINEMILRESSEQHIRDYALQVKSSGNALIYLISDILDLSKIEAGKMEIVPVDYDVRKVISDVLMINFPRIDSKGLAYVCKIDPEIPSVLHGDDMRLRQVLINLITNAIKYTDSGTVTLSVTMSKKHETSVKLRFSVKDTGIGIKHEDQAMLFESFQRVDMEHNKNVEGTGLGLNLTQQFLGLMNSKLKVKSEYGFGSDFYFDLDQPIVDASPIGEFSWERTRVEVGSTYREGFTAKDAQILVVDDYKLNLVVFKGLMKNSLMQIDTASSGKEALELIARKHYDMVFLDHMMPDMDGIEVLACIKNDGALLANVGSVIALTANAIIGAREQYMAAGFDDYLVKPIMGQELEACIHRWLPAELITLVDHSEAELEKSMPEERAEEKDTFLDMNVAMQYCGGDKSIFKELVDGFVQSGFLENLESTYASGDWAKYKVHVHGLKSAAKSIGAMKLSDAAKEVELAIQEKEDYDFASERHPYIIEETRKLIDYITQMEL